MRCASLFGFPTLTSASFAQVFQGLGVVSGQNASVANAISSEARLLLAPQFRSVVSHGVGPHQLVVLISVPHLVGSK